MAKVTRKVAKTRVKEKKMKVVEAKKTKMVGTRTHLVDDGG